MDDIGALAKKWYEENEPPGALASALLRCLFYGAIVKKHDFILMGEPIRVEGKTILFQGEANAWWVHFWGAKKGKYTCFDVADAAPYYLPYIVFKRRGKIKVRTWESFLKDTNPNKLYFYGGSTKSTGT